MCQNPNHWLKVCVSEAGGARPFYSDEVPFGGGDTSSLRTAITAVLQKAELHDHQKVVVELLPYCRGCGSPAGAGVSGSLLYSKVPKGKEDEFVGGFVDGLLAAMQAGNLLLHQARVLADYIELAIREDVPPHRHRRTLH